MPEIPDLENIQSYLNGELPGVGIASVEAEQPLVIRLPTLAEFIATVQGNSFDGVRRRGKFLLFDFDSGHTLAVNPMLTGRLQYCDPSTKRGAKTCFVLGLDNGKELRYFDSRLMGKVYLVPDGALNIIPRFTEMGPEALDPKVTVNIFENRLRRHPGQIKNILVNDTFLAGIGNAYADEILFDAGIHPYRRRTTLSTPEIEVLYRSMHSVLEEATKTVRRRMNGRIDLKIRDFLKVHGKGQEVCPVCGGRISQVQANQRLTNFCRQCQR
ncbi:MAG: Fpg/Nei family DNA glycosylase [Dehalococcoidia bacterium]